MGTAPTCAGPTVAAPVTPITTGNALAARVPLRFSVTNIPNPLTEDYELCVSYQVTD
jgi:hypothetical protein